MEVMEVAARRLLDNLLALLEPHLAVEPLRVPL